MVLESLGSGGARAFAWSEDCWDSFIVVLRVASVALAWVPTISRAAELRCQSYCSTHSGDAPQLVVVEYAAKLGVWWEK